jgi:hypothetical protein
MIRSIDVSDLPDPVVRAIEQVVDAFRRQVQTSADKAAPPIGWLKGQWELTDSFFEPLPSDMLDAFEGGKGQPNAAMDRPRVERFL